MTTKIGGEDAINILSFGASSHHVQDRRAPSDRQLDSDSGGPGTYSQLLILNEYMNRITLDQNESDGDVYPADYFDLMGGVGFGG